MPYITPNWIYVGMPKTGSHYIHTALMDCFGQEGFTAEIDSYHLLSEQQQKIPLLTSVRNPWTWYVSHWAWFSHPRTPPDSRRYINEDITFPEWIRQNPRIMVEELAWHYPMPPNPVTRKTIRLENMAEDLILALEYVGQPVSIGQQDIIRNMPILNKNPTRDKPYQEYYEAQELRDLIIEGARPVFEEFYSTFEFPSETEDDNVVFSTGL